MLIRSIFRVHKCSGQINCFQSIQKRFIDDPKKFYKIASVNLNDKDRYEIVLDKRKLKTPKGQLFEIKNESLAHAVAQEWNAQEGTIKRSEMHLTTLINTHIDNPSKLTKQQIIDSLVNQLQCDTLCYRVSEPEDLSNYLKNGWDPVIKEFETMFQCKLPVTETVFLDDIPVDTLNKIKQYLNSFDFNSIFGLQFIYDNLKSIVLSLALINKSITVDEAVHLSRLEQQYQIDKWGEVEWAHTLDLNVQRSRVSAGLMHFLLTNEYHRQSVKQSN